MVNGIWIACSNFLGSIPIYQEVTFDLLLTKICVVVNRDLANYLWKRELLVAEMSQYSLQQILNDFLSHSSFFEHIELFRCVLHWLNDFLSSSGNPGNHCSTISNYGIFDMFNHDPVFVVNPRICNKITAPHSVIRLVVSPKTCHIESLKVMISQV